jgi:hypothetical protein
MLKRLFYASAATVALSYAAPAAAATCGTSVMPSDLPSAGGANCTLVTPQYETNPAIKNTVIDANITPPTQTGLTNIPLTNYTNRVQVGPPGQEFTGTGTGCTGYGLVIALGGDSGCAEAKFRTNSDFGFYAPDDPIRNFGAPGASHLHCFFGNGSTNAYSTHTSLRRRAITSTAAGADVNGTGYWYPCVIVKNRDGDGVSYVVKPDHITIYYVRDANDATSLALARKSAAIPPGLRYVFGYNMDDGTNADGGVGGWLKTILDATNAAIGSTRYTTTHNGLALSAGEYACVGSTADPSVQGQSTDRSKYLKKPDGGDPFNGTCESATFSGSASAGVLTVTSIDSGVMQVGQSLLETGTNTPGDIFILSQRPGGTPGGIGTYNLNKSDISGTYSHILATHQFFIGVNGPDCWDGKNLWSPGGYKHLIAGIFDAQFGVFTCPKNYYTLPSITLEIGFTQYGWADRQRWQLSSDAARRTALGGSTTTYPDGFSFHTDWDYGWDNTQMIKWEQSCLGVLNHDPHQCAVSRISSTENLVAIGADGPLRHPQIDPQSLSRRTNSGPGWGKIPPSWLSSIGPHHVHP